MKEKYQELYEQAKAYEKPNKINGNVFFWCANESLAELERPERIAEIKANYERAQEKKRASRKNKGLMSVLADFEDDDEERVGCTICSL